MTPDNYAHIYSVEGEGAIATVPAFVDASRGNFYLKPAVPDQARQTGRTEMTQPTLGALPSMGEEGPIPQPWWHNPFPPECEFGED